MASYFMLITREEPGKLWVPQFGDHDKEGVMEERRLMRQTDKNQSLAPYGRTDCYKVIAVKSARRCHCDAALARLNAKEA